MSISINYYQHAHLTTYEPAPARSLDGSSSSIELLLHVLNTAKRLVDGLLQGSIAQKTAIALAHLGGGREVLPEERVVDVT